MQLLGLCYTTPRRSLFAALHLLELRHELVHRVRLLSIWDRLRPFAVGGHEHRRRIVPGREFVQCGLLPLLLLDFARVQDCGVARAPLCDRNVRWRLEGDDVLLERERVDELALASKGKGVLT